MTEVPPTSDGAGGDSRRGPDRGGTRPGRKTAVQFGMRRGARQWCAITSHRDVLSAACIVRGDDGRPRLSLFDHRADGGAPAATLRALRREHRLDRYRVSMLLPQGQYQFHTLEAPQVPATEWKDAVRWRLQDRIDYPAEEAVVDVLPMPPGPGGSAATLNVVSARRAAVADWVRCCDEAGLSLEAVDVHETVQRNLAALAQPDGRPVAFIGAAVLGHGLLTITAGDDLYLARTLDMHDSSAEDVAAGQQPYERATVEIQRSLDHFDRQYGGVPVARVVVGPGTRTESICTALAANLDVPVEALDIRSIIDCGTAAELQEPVAQGAFLRLIGAALRSA